MRLEQSFTYSFFVGARVLLISLSGSAFKTYTLALTCTVRVAQCNEPVIDACVVN